MAWLLLALWTAVIGAAVAITVLSWSRTRFRRQLASAEALWHLRNQQDSPGTVIENVSLGWLNLLLQSLWTPVVEKHVAGLTTELLQKVFAEVLAKGSQKAPWKYLDSIGVEELSFGLVPPTFQVAQAKYDPTASMLTMSVDVRFTTSSSAQAVLLVRSKAVGMFAPVTVRLEVTHVKLRGRLRLGLALGQEAPGIKGVYYSFTSPPHLDVAVRPLGLPLPSVVPGVDTALRGVLNKLISRRLVEPQRRYIDIHRIYMNKHIARVGGPAGLLKVVIVCARDLYDASQQPPQPPEAAAAEASGATPDGLKTKSKSSKPANKLSSYCEVRFGQLVLRTPIVHHVGAADATWNWQLSLPLARELDAAGAATAAGAAGGQGNCRVAAGSSPAAAGAAGGGGSRRASVSGSSESSNVVSLLVFDAQTVGQPVLLGKAKVSLDSLKLQPNGAAKTLVLALQKAHSSKAMLNLNMQWLKSTKQAPTQQQQQQSSRVQRGMKAPAQPQTQPEQQQLPGLTTRSWDSSRTEQVLPGAPSRLPEAHRSVSALGPSNKSVSWHDKTQLRVKSAASAAKRSLKQLRSCSSPSLADEILQHAADDGGGGEAGPEHEQAGDGPHAGSSAEQRHAGGPWDLAPAPPRAASSMAGSAPAAAQQLPGSRLPAATQAGHVPYAAHAAEPYHAAESPGSCQHQAAAGANSGYSFMYGSSFSNLAEGMGLWQGLKDWGSWLWPVDGSQQAPVPAAAPSAAAPAHAPAPSACSSPWPDAGPDVDEDGGEPEWPSTHSSNSALSTSSTSPLALLSHVVHMQKELEQQRMQLEVAQQQLAHTSNSYQRLKQMCRQRGRSALLQGARFLLHKPDGSTQHILLYISQQGSAKGVQPSRLGRQQLQPAEQGLMLVIAALPETRSEARTALKRLTAGAGDELAATAAAGAAAAAAAAAGDGGTASSGAHHAAAAPMSSGGGVSGVASGAGPRLSAFGSVGAGLRLRLQRGTMLQMGYESGKLPRAALQTLKSVPAGQLVGVVRGSTHFVVPANGSALASAAVGGSSRAAECFTLLVQEDASGSVTAINLQLPHTGNGRNLDEWILALRDVASAVEPSGIDNPGAAAASAFPVGTGAANHSPGTAGSRATQRLSLPDTHMAPEPFNAEQRPRALSEECPVADVIDRTVSNTQQALEGRDWLLPAAAAAAAKPWPVAKPASSNGTGHDSSSGTSESSGSDSDDAS